MQKEIKKIINLLLKETKKEYLCHLRYVAEIGLRLAKEHGGLDLDVIEASCLLHDIGRDKEFPGEDHAETGRRIAKEVLKNSKFTEEQKQKIYLCISSHGSDEVPKTIEEQIIRSADAGSKVEYHEAFMLMCKKTIYEERLAWGMKYLHKGFNKISILWYKKKVRPKYESINEIYQNILNLI